MSDRELAIFSPVPPEQNGIADYTYHLLSALKEELLCAVYAHQPDGILPSGVAIREPEQAYRYIRPTDDALHQLGNNPGHVFVLEALRKWGGVVTLHDQNLHYLYEISKAPRSLLVSNMRRLSPKLGSTFSRHWFDCGVKTKANYALFDMLSETLELSSAVIVHSNFARNRIRLLYGEELAGKVHVIPHLALPAGSADQNYIRGVFNVPSGVPIVVSAGFATFAKRFDWLVEALAEMVSRGVDFYWIHAGKERQDEFDLSALLARFPAVKERCKITGYLSDQDLSDFIASCDVLVNLRFPSVGESSGTLARAMAAGRCCILSDTAGYSEIPRSAALHVPVTNTIPALIDALGAALRDRGLRERIGSAARSLSLSEWAPRAVARAYTHVLKSHPRVDRAKKRPNPELLRVTSLLDSTTLKPDIDSKTRGGNGLFEIRLVASSIDQIARISLARPNLFEEVLPEDLHLQSVVVEPHAPGPLTGESSIGLALILRGEIG